MVYAKESSFLEVEMGKIPKKTTKLYLKKCVIFLRDDVPAPPVTIQALRCR